MAAALVERCERFESVRGSHEAGDDFGKGKGGEEMDKVAKNAAGCGFQRTSKRIIATLAGRQCEMGRNSGGGGRAGSGGQGKSTAANVRDIGFVASTQTPFHAAQLAHSRGDLGSFKKALAQTYPLEHVARRVLARTIKQAEGTALGVFLKGG